MKPGIRKARRKLDAVSTSLGITETYPRPGHDLQKDVHILKARLHEMMRSHPGIRFPDRPDGLRPPEPSAATEPERAARPMVTVEELVSDIDRWKGRNVIIEGELVFSDRGSGGSHWHRFHGGTAFIPAVSKEMIKSGHGTLFGIADVTKTGGQPFLEIRNFHHLREE
jgi:hypothetical protein